jgi:2-methylaconitate cis-trans-isomerase PrpF
VRIHNTNTKKLIVAHVPVAGGEAAVSGDFELPGVPGRAPHRARLPRRGAGTGRLLPTGRARDAVSGVAASCVDATNPVVFVRARPGLGGAEGRRRSTPTGADRAAGGDPRGRRRAHGDPRSAATPKVALVAPRPLHRPRRTAYGAERVDLVARVMSMGTATAPSR